MVLIHISTKNYATGEESDVQTVIYDGLLMHLKETIEIHYPELKFRSQVSNSVIFDIDDDNSIFFRLEYVDGIGMDAIVNITKDMMEDAQ